jgi:carbon monoxide dehydrogenase subunit G
VSEIKVHHSFSLPVSGDEVWALLWDVEAVARCIPGCQAVVTREVDRAYEATVRCKFGPFLIGMKLDIEVIKRTPRQSICVAVIGRDPRLKSDVSQTLDIQLREDDGGTSVGIQSALTIDGLLATFSNYLIEMQIKQVLNDFAENLVAKLNERVTHHQGL